jgi:hypothetical protein
MVLGELYIRQERLNEASELFKKLISRVSKENKVPILLASLYLGLAKVAFLHGNNQQAYALHGHIVDQSALYGVLRTINDLGLELISVNRLEEES